MTAPSEAQSLRDAVARVIEPAAWVGYNSDHRGLPCYTQADIEHRDYMEARRAPSLAKADALLTPTGPIGAHIAKIEAERDAAVAHGNLIGDSYADENQRFHDRFTAAEAQVATLTARLAEVEAALEPFASYAPTICRTRSDAIAEVFGGYGPHRVTLTAGHFRAARSALSNKESGHE